MKFLDIEFAPLWVPIERRLQIIGVAYLVLNIALSSFVSWFLTFYLLVYGNIWIRSFMIAYLIYIYRNSDARFKGGWSKWAENKFRSLNIWRHACNYFPIKLIKTADLDPTRNYLFCSFPHGMLATGASAAFSTYGVDCQKVFPGLDFHEITLDQHFSAPFAREFFLLLGGRSSDSKSINYLLSEKPLNNRGRVVVLVVGGAAEALKCKPGTYEILLKKRKGFVKLALKNGTPLVPVFTFGETDLYDQMDNPKGSKLRKFQDFYKKYTGFAPAIPIGRGFFQYTFGLLPRRKPLFVVVGAPLELPKLENPTREDVNKYHALFTKSLVNLFEIHKSKYIKNYKNVSLVLNDD